MSIVLSKLLKQFNFFQIECQIFTIIFVSQRQYMKRQDQRIAAFKENIEQTGLGQSQLKWSGSQSSFVVSGMSDLTTLSRLKNVILALRKDWSSQLSGGIKVQGHQNYDKRLLLIQNQIDGLLKRRINYSVKDSNGGERVLDYTGLLNQKENQIVQLEKKIQNIEEKLRRASARQIQLEEHVTRLTLELKRKEEIIQLKHNSAVAELANSNAFRDVLNKIKKNIQMQRYKLGEAQKIIMDGVVIPELGSFEIKPDAFGENLLASRSKVYQQQPEPVRYKTRLVQFFREFERLLNQVHGITDFEVERIIEGFISNNMPETKLYQKMQYSIEHYKQIQDYKRIKQNFTVAAAIFGDLVVKLKNENIHYQLPQQINNIFQLLQRQKIVGMQMGNGTISIEMDVNSAKIVEVPVQDARTKHLIHLLATELKRLFLKFPRLQTEIDGRLAEFIQQEVIDVIEVDELQKLIQIVKYVPQIVKVQNVYAHCTQKERKMEFHLRILIKALLEELQKVKLKTGVTLEIDEGVVGMIKAEIMDVVNVDDILKVFRVTPKIVQVQKIIEKIVQRIIEVPKVVTVQKLVQKIVEVQKIKQVERIVHVPIEKPMIVETEKQKLVPYQNKIETIIQVPTIVEKIVELQKIVPKVMEVEVIKEKIVQVEVPVQVERVVNHIQTKYEPVEIVIQKIVTVEKIVEKIIQVPVYHEKIVEKIVQVPTVVEVERVVEKIVPVIEYRSAREVENHIEIKYQIVDRIVEKIVPVVQIKERIKEVPQQIEVIKQVTNVITQIKEVEVIREKLVIKQVIKQVEKVVTKLIEVIKEVPVQIEKYIEIPIIKEVLVIKQLIVEKVVIQRIESVHMKEVILREPFIVKQPTVVEVQKFVNVYIEVPKFIKYIQQKIVQVPTIIDRIKEVPVIVQKIIEKMVEVPRVVQVQKIVQKVVVVPRVIQKVVEVPQIVEKVIQKEIIREKIVQVEKIVHVPVIQQVIKEVIVQKNIFIEVEKPVDRIVERAVQVPKFQEKIITKQIVREVPITVIQEVPVQLQVEKIVPLAYQCVKAIQVDRPIIVPFEIPVPVEVIVERIIPKEQIIERIIPTPQIIEKIVPLVETVVQFQQIQKIVQRILIQKQIKQVEKIVPYIQQVIKEVPTYIEKLVTVEKHIDNIVTVERIIEKVIQKTISLPQVYEVERVREKLVEVPKLIQIQRIVPQIIRVNQYIQKIVEKLIQVPTIIESMKQIVRQQQRIVPLKETITEIVQVERCVQKLVYAQKLKEVVRNVNYIEKVLQIIDRIEHVPVAITTTEQKFIEVPFILQKIVEKIIVMPQIVQVLKYVHEVCESESIGVAVNVDVGTHEARYKELSKNIEIHLDGVIKQLRYLKTDQATRSRIEVIEKFLQQLRRFILVPRIVKVVEQKIIEKQVNVDRFVTLPVQDEHSLKTELSLSILVQKLIAELKRIKQKTGANLELDEDIKLIFFTELNANTALEGQILKRLQSYTSHVYRQFQSLGNWTTDHQLMLNSFMQQRFLMAQLIQNANFEIEQARAFNESSIANLTRSKSQSQRLSNFLLQISTIVKENRPIGQISSILEQYQKIQKSPDLIEPVFYLGDLVVNDERIESLLRQKDIEISVLKNNIFQIQHKGQSSSSIAQQEGIIKVLRADLESLKKENSTLLAKTSESGLLQSFKNQIHDLQARNLQLEGQISRLKSQNYNLLQQKGLIMQNVSFRKQPQLAFQEIDIRQSNIDRSRFSQSSQGLSLSNYQVQDKSSLPQYSQSVLIKPGQSRVDETTSKKMDAPQPFDSRISQSGSKPAQSKEQLAFQGAFLSQSSAYAQKPGSYQSVLQTNLYQSQKRETGQSKYQSGQAYQPYQSGVRYPGAQSSQFQGVQPQGGQVQGSQVQGSSQIGGQTIRSQVGQTSPIQISQSGLQYIRPDLRNFGVQDGQSLKLQQSGAQFERSRLQGRINTLSQSGVLQRGQVTEGPSITQTQSRVEQSGYQTRYPGQSGVYSVGQTGLYGQSSQLQGQGGLYSSRQQGSKDIIPPATQTIVYGQGLGGQQSTRSYGSRAPGMTQEQTLSSTGYQQQSIYSTPIQSYKYMSPSPSGGKLAQSIIKNEESLSKVQAQSPQVPRAEETPKSGYQQYYRQVPKKQ